MTRAPTTILATGLLLLLTRTAWPQTDDDQTSTSQPATQPTVGEDTPWAKGVSAEKRRRALTLYKQGNRLFADEKYSDALARYEEAVEHWDHPGIHYNMVECLVNLGRNLAAHHHLKAAMRFGEAPLGKHLYRQAKTYRNMLARTLARIRVACREPGAKVALDGKALFVGPGQATRLVEPGIHAVVASKPGFIPMAQQPSLSPGKLTEVTLRLIPRTTKVVLERRWDRTWWPWTVLGVGVAIAAASLPLYLLARNDFDDHKRRFDELCIDEKKPEGGCILADLSDEEHSTWNNLEDLKGRATSEYHASIALLSAGAAVAAAGITLVILNLPRVVERPTKVPTLSVSVTAAPGSLGLTVKF